MALFDRQTINQFVSGMPIPGLSVEGLAHNARLSDVLSRRGRIGWLDYISILGEFPENSYDNPTLLGKASFQFQTGMTTLTIAVLADGWSEVPVYSGTHTLKVYFDGVLRGSMALSQGYNNLNITISTLGLTNDQIVEVRAEVTWTVTQGAYRWVDAYCSPVGGSLGSYPGVPTFGNPTLANLELLRTTDAWLWSRLTAADRAIMTTYLWWPGNASDDPANNTKFLWTGSVARAGNANRLIVGVDYWIVANQQEVIEVLADPTGTRTFTVVAATGTLTTGATGTWQLDLDVSTWPDNTPVYVMVRQRTIQKAADPEFEFGSLFTVRQVSTQCPTPTWNSWPSESTPAESLTWTSAQGRLNTIATSINTTYNRLGNTADVWNRQRAFRQPPITNDGNREHYKARLVARGQRYADYLWVRGKNLSIGWGGYKNTWAHDTRTLPEFVNSKSLTGNDTIETVRVPFDTLESLYEGTTYHVTGDEIIYVGEEVI